ncbi:uncharacterized protein [Notothenia coriiceps]|uniref:Uncharacterized protein n=1 Tax=Notothenia coriiceps TaxID=8208 RepID=A0A6I9PWG1_9TELE|nr:PREDICTED: uncharacterized protein LOC104965236 [Notothenia coriiceps]
MSYDQHAMCESCLGPEHADAALSQQVACSHCARLPSADSKRRADALAAAADEDDWPVQEHVDGSMSLEPSAGQESDDSYPVSLHGSPCGSPLPPLPRTGETESEQGAGLAAEHAVPFSVATGRRPTLSSPVCVCRPPGRPGAPVCLSGGGEYHRAALQLGGDTGRAVHHRGRRNQQGGQHSAHSVRVRRCLPGEDFRVGDTDPAPPLAAAGVCYGDGQKTATGRSNQPVRAVRTPVPPHGGVHEDGRGTGGRHSPACQLAPAC